jgi:hypothetical protein
MITVLFAFLSGVLFGTVGLAVLVIRNMDAKAK